MLPRLRLLLLFLIAGLPFLGVAWWPPALYLGAGLIVIAVVVAAGDLWLAPKPNRVVVSRDVADVLSLGAGNPVRVRLRNRNRKPISVEIEDEPPAPSTTDELPARAVLPPNRRRLFVYRVTPRQRGNKAFGILFLRSQSRLGLWDLTAEFHERRIVRVYPDIRAIQKTELLARQNRLAEAGVRLSRLRGRGSEFDRLREYRREDEYRAIDWKATARQSELISREYVVERNQNVILVLDCGRGMCNALDGISHFDRALNAAILLAYVALRQGDSVGLMAVSNRIERRIPLLRSRSSASAIVARSYDITPRYEASDYELMVEELRKRYRKRSLVILCTHALDEVHLGQIGKAIRQLRTPHLLLTAFLRNVPLSERVNAIPETDLEAFQIASAAAIDAAQTKQVRRLVQSGHLVVDSKPEDLSARIVSQYLEIKAKHLL